MRKRNKWIAAGVGLWLTGAVCIGSGVFLDNPGVALTRAVQAATQSETTQGQIDAANKKREQLEKERTELKGNIFRAVRARRAIFYSIFQRWTKRWTR